MNRAQREWQRPAGGMEWEGDTGLYAPEVWAGLLPQRAFVKLTDTPQGAGRLAAEGAW